jgi:hypothetical protein
MVNEAAEVRRSWMAEMRRTAPNCHAPSTPAVMESCSWAEKCWRRILSGSEQNHCCWARERRVSSKATFERRKEGWGERVFGGAASLGSVEE